MNDFNYVVSFVHNITNRVQGFQDSRVLVNSELIFSHLNPCLPSGRLDPSAP